jgi:hypothetical protein
MGGPLGPISLCSVDGCRTASVFEVGPMGDGFGVGNGGVGVARADQENKIVRVVNVEDKAGEG